MNDQEKINQLLTDYTEFVNPQTPGEQKYRGKSRAEYEKEIIAEARKVIPKNTVIEDRDIGTALDVLNAHLKTGKEVGPASTQVSALTNKAKALRINKDQIQKLEGVLRKAEQNQVTLSESRISAILNEANIPQFYHEQFKEVIPQGPFLFIPEVETSKTIFSSAQNMVVSRAVKKMGGESVSKAVIGTLGKVGALGGPVGSVVSLLTAKYLPQISSFVVRNGKKIAMGTFGVIIGGFVLGIPGMAIGGVTGVAAASIGTSGVASALSAIPAIVGGMGGAVMGALAIPLIVGLIVTPIIIALILFIINSGAYITPQSSSSQPGQVSSPYIGITKTASPSGPFKKDEPNLKDKLKGITYTVSITAKKGALTNISFENICHITKDGTPPPCEVPIPDKAPATISPTEPFKFVYVKDFSADSYMDTFINDTFTVTADTQESQGEKASATAILKIGDPPEDCPSGWPTSIGTITRGAYSTATHLNAEAIDIGGLPVGSRVTARNSGVVKVRDHGTLDYGKHVILQSSCNGQNFVSVYAHLSAVNINDGAFVTLGQEIGRSGSTGNSTGPHLHYEFRIGISPQTTPASFENSIPPYMMNTDDPKDNPDAYIPVDVKRHCEGVGSCNTSITTKR